MAERKVRFFGHIIRKKTHGRKECPGEDGRQAANGQTCKDLGAGLKRLDKAGHADASQVATDERFTDNPIHETLQCHFLINV